MGAIIQKLLTVDEFEKTRNPKGGRYELHHGELVEVTFPNARHKKLERRLRQLLSEPANTRGIVEIEVAYRPLPEYEVWCADVAFVSQTRWDSMSPEGWLQGSPEMVIEIQSASNTAEELEDNEITCLAGGCKEFCVIYRKLQIVKVTNAAGVRRYRDTEVIPLSLFPGSFIGVREVFQV